MQYTYSVANDTANGDLNPNTLEQEIRDSSLTVALDYIARNNDVLDIFFKANLPAQEQTDLSALISAHTAEADNQPDEVQLVTKTPLGIPKVAVTKPDGESRTYISHNFCDDTTWPAANNSAWELDSVVLGLGKLKVYRAEVQFTHDVELSTQTTPGEMEMDVIAGGSPVPSEAKVFKSLLDVFDLGNKHYSMDATVDGIPGLTTVQFDYTDAIILDPALGMKIRFQMKNHAKMGGTHCSVSLVAGPA